MHDAAGNGALAAEWAAALTPGSTAINEMTVAEADA
jgi:hypothetical protein